MTVAYEIFALGAGDHKHVVWFSLSAHVSSSVDGQASCDRTWAMSLGPRPLLLVDIDGVLSPYGAESCPEGYEEHQLFPDDPKPHRICPAHGRWLMELTEDFEVVWASAWGLVAHELVGPILGVARFSFVPMPEIPFPPAAKVPAVAAYAGSRAVAWLDDALGADAIEWAACRCEPTLLVPVDPAVGLLRSHVDQVLAWKRRLHR